MAYHEILDPPHQPDPWQTPPPVHYRTPGNFDQLEALAIPEAPHPTPPQWRPVRVASAWSVIALCTVVIMVMQAWMMQMTPPPPPDAQPGLDMVMFGRLAVGMDQVLASKDPSMVAEMDGLSTLSPFPTTDSMRVAIVAGELFGTEAASERLSNLYSSNLSPTLEPTSTFENDQALLKRIYSDEAYTPTASETQGLIQRHGWFGELAAGYNLNASDTLFQTPRAAASRTIWLAMGFGLLVILASLAGLGLFVTAIIIGSMGKLNIRFTPGTLPHASAYLEMVAIFMAAFILLQLFAAFAALQTGIDLLLPVLALLVLPVFWPLLCGISFEQYRKDMGLNAPKGLLREIGAGILGYLAGLPILFVGAIISVVFAIITGMNSEHPAGREILTGSTYEVLVLVLAAVIWAPVVEELIFRAAFYRHLRHVPGWATWVLATLLTSFVFAAIHPQGIIGIPVLMSIACVLAALRQWRGSLVAPITAHALHNGTIITFIIVLLYL